MKVTVFPVPEGAWATMFLPEKAIGRDMAFGRNE